MKKKMLDKGEGLRGEKFEGDCFIPLDTILPSVGSLGASRKLGFAMTVFHTISRVIITTTNHKP